MTLDTDISIIDWNTIHNHGAVIAKRRSSLDAEEARWLREDDKATLQELADQYGVSAERIRQIESKALKTMRSQMAAQ